MARTRTRSRVEAATYVRGVDIHSAASTGATGTLRASTSQFGLVAVPSFGRSSRCVSYGTSDQPIVLLTCTVAHPISATPAR